MLKRWAIHYITKHLLRFISEEDLLRPDGKGGIICRGKKVSREMQDQMAAEAEYIQNSITFKLLMTDMEFLANQTMFKKSSSFDDMMFGKVMLYVIDILKKKIANLSK